MTHYAYHDELTEQKTAQCAYNIEYIKYNDLNTIFLCLYNKNRSLK